MNKGTGLCVLDSFPNCLENDLGVVSLSKAKDSFLALSSVRMFSLWQRSGRLTAHYWRFVLLQLEVPFMYTTYFPFHLLPTILLCMILTQGACAKMPKLLATAIDLSSEILCP